MSTLTLSLVIHNHQPVGNLDHVFAEATKRAYDPMLEAVTRHPGVRLGLHYSGPLLDWLGTRRPDHLDRLGDLVARGQVELLTGGYYEPVLATIPDADRLGQLRKMTAFLLRRFGHRPTGAWIAERVWEPHLPRPLVEAGVEYTLLDDTPFKMVGLTDDDLFGPYITEEQGYALKVFGNVMHLRYAIPWQPVETVIEWLRQRARAHPGGVAVAADDGEKFGLWPDTWSYCWGEDGWVNRFFAALEENADWLHTRPLGEVAAEHTPLGRVYLPCASYEEMMHWALPPRAQVDLATVQRDLEEQAREDVRRFVRGGFWRSFLCRYDEVNQMHKKMLWVSRKAHAMPPGEARQQALDHTWSAQCNCAYWHGLFGGIYFFHIRAANFAHLIAAEELADRQRMEAQTWAVVERGDFDADGHEEIILNTDQQVLIFKPSYGGGLVEWDWRDRRYNLLNTMTRRPEGYHETLRKAEREGRIFLPGQEEIPNGVRVKERDVHTSLFYDWHRRIALLDHFLDPGTTPETFYQAHYAERGDFVDRPYQAEVEEDGDLARLVLTREGTVWAGEVPIPVQIQKTVAVEAGSPQLTVNYRVTNRDDIPADLRFGVAFNWGIVGGDSEYGYLHTGAERRDLNALEGDQHVAALTIGSTLPDLDGEVHIDLGRAASLWQFPLEVVSNSEAGYERVYQGTCTLLWWDMLLEPGRHWDAELILRLRRLQP
ncbi:MAG: alpha-amylase/4-alpha-glucanotransferase domain-containing protein [Chloroflexota bacterium]|nr:alpha-amylase/4-alpha-glucanotransferase domain-containing protein [Chloroflexota bacterium]